MSASVFVCERGNTWGCHEWERFDPQPLWPVHTNSPFAQSQPLLASTAFVYSPSPPKDSKFIIYHFAYYFPPTLMQLPILFSPSLAFVCPTRPLFSQPLSCPSHLLTVNFHLYAWADWASRFIHYQFSPIWFGHQIFEYLFSILIVGEDLTVYVYMCMYECVLILCFNLFSPPHLHPEVNASVSSCIFCLAIGHEFSVAHILALNTFKMTFDSLIYWETPRLLYIFSCPSRSDRTTVNKSHSANGKWCYKLYLKLRRSPLVKTTNFPSFSPTALECSEFKYEELRWMLS